MELTLLIGGLQEVGAHTQVQALVARDPAAHVTVDHPMGVAWLIKQMRVIGAHT
ncbi:hypothetical protein [Nocardia fluminea]|uniref:hypothetical protein n=1 Tax=Nocardia fluminea TaxID=134984 RepID=UPI003667D06A